MKYAQKAKQAKDGPRVDRPSPNEEALNPICDDAYVIKECENYKVVILEETGSAVPVYKKVN